MTKLTKQRISIGAAVLLLIGLYALANVLASQGEAPPKRERERSVRQVATRVASPGSLDISVPLQGRLVSFETVPLFTEVTGVFAESARSFKIGVYYKKGDVLARLDDAEARYALLASKSQLANSLAQSMPELKIDYPATFPAWDAYLRDFDPERVLPPLPDVADDAARFFLNARNIYGQYYTIKGSEERLSKYTLRAPVSGTLTAVSATVGALVRANQQIGTLTASNYELSATVPVADLNYLKSGTTAELHGPGGRAYTGQVSRISTQIDPNTQTATVYLSVRGPELREGLYLQGDAAGESLADVVALDQGLLVGSDEVYVVTDSTLQRETVEIIRRSGEQVFVRGLTPGAALLAEQLPGAYTGMRVSPTDEADAADDTGGSDTTTQGGASAAAGSTTATPAG